VGTSINVYTSVPVLVGTSTQDARRKTQAHAARRQQAAQADAASKKRTLVNETWFTLLCNKVQQINAMHLIQCRFLVHLQQAIAIALRS
jgi:uncharacterized protein involved in type VI secretion and phage assembly